MNGLNIGKTIGKNIDKEYIEEFKQLTDVYIDIKEDFTLYKPKHLSKEQILNTLQIYKDSNEKYHDFDFSYDEALMVFSMIIVKGINHKLLDEVKTNYIQIPKTEWLKWIGVRYYFYLEAFIDSEIIECDNIYYNFHDRKKALSYKINNKYIQKDELTGNIFDTKILENWRLKVKTFKIKIQLRDNEKDLPPYLISMKEYVREIYKNHFNIKEIEKYYTESESRLYEFYELKNDSIEENRKEYKTLTENINFLYLADYFLYFKVINENGIYFNSKDKFGERFHSVFTNIKSVFRNWINFDGVKYKEIDIVNSQMSFFSLLFSHTEEVKVVLPEYKKYLEELNNYKENKDIKQFIQYSSDGLLYEWINFNIGYNSRKKAKETMFHVLFSNEKEYRHTKSRLSILIPSIIEICNRFNTEYDKMISRLCQLLESRIMIHRIGNQLTEQSKFPFITIHDSFSLHPNDIDKFQQLYKETFDNLNIKPLKIKIK